MRKLLPRPCANTQQHQGETCPGALRKHPRAQVPIACDACRKRKSKCDRRRPKCVQCALSRTECHFTAPRAPAGYGHLPSSDLLSFLDLVRSGSSGESTQLLDRVRQAPSAHDFVESVLGAGPPVSDAPWSTPLLKALTRRGSHPHLSLSSHGLLPSIEPLTISADLVSRFPNGLLPISQWTALSVDNRYLTHLLNLFFAWDGALSHTIHRTAFLEGIKSPEASATLNVCSKFLVHSLLAVSHLYLSQGVSPSQVREIRSRGREFADEALRTLNQERIRPSISLAQGLVLLWAYEVNFGQENGAVALLDEFYRIFDALATKIDTPTATPNRLKSQSSLESESTAVAIWGFFCLESKISLTFSRKMRIRPPQLARPFTGPASFTTTTPGATENFWFPYPDARCTQPSYFRDMITYECQLAELAWEASPFFGFSGYSVSRPDYQETVAMYNKLLAWNTAAVQDFLLNKGILPSVLFLDVTFQMIQVKLLACLSRFDTSKIELQTHTSTGASHGSSIISSLSVYRAAYGARHEYWLGQACFEGAVALLSGHRDNPGLSKAIVSACELLLLFGNYLPPANRYLWVLKALAIRLEIVLPKTCERLFSILAARDGRTKVKNIKLLDVGPTENGIGFGVPSDLPCELIFSGLIESFQSLE